MIRSFFFMFFFLTISRLKKNFCTFTFRFRVKLFDKYFKIYIEVSFKNIFLKKFYIVSIFLLCFFMSVKMGIKKKFFFTFTLLMYYFLNIKSKIYKKNKDFNNNLI